MFIPYLNVWSLHMCVSFSMPSAVFALQTGHYINVIHAKCHLPSHWSLLLPTSVWCIIFLSGSCDIIPFTQLVHMTHYTKHCFTISAIFLPSSHMPLS